jgi:glycosyltransferase involved in cell wall biosynthesis
VIDVSVILCTYNRSRSLINALESIAACSMPESVQWEVLVIDNNSTDNTRAVTEKFRSRYAGRFRYIFEQRQGLSQARNTGIREARGKIIAFVDDDVTVGPRWLEEITSVFHDGEWSGAGGRILPERGFIPPYWLALDGRYSLLGALCAHYDRGDASGEMKTPAYGANMAFRAEMFEKYGGFRTDLGRSSNDLMSNEDTEFGRRLIDGGERLRYVASSVVYHAIHEGRVHKGFFLSWWYDFGRARIIELGVRPKIWGVSRHYISLPNNILRVLPSKALRWLFSFNPQQRFFNKCMTWSTVGRIVEIWRQSRQPDDAYKMQSARDALR